MNRSKGFKTNLSGNTIRYGSLIIKACISDTLLADVMAIRNETFSVRSHKDMFSLGKKGSLDRASSTTERSQTGKEGFLGSLSFRQARWN